MSKEILNTVITLILVLLIIGIISIFIYTRIGGMFS